MSINVDYDPEVQRQQEALSKQESLRQFREECLGGNTPEEEAAIDRTFSDGWDAGEAGLKIDWSHWLRGGALRSEGGDIIN